MFLRAGIFLCVLLATQGSAQDIDLTSFTPCRDKYNDTGLMCGTTCEANYLWCLENEIDQFQCNIGSDKISSTDSRLCSNPEVWREVDCNMHYDDGRVRRYGTRCTGKNMQCTYPWYTAYDGEPLRYASCADYSDQIFEVNQTCRQNLQRHLDFHHESFCNEKYPKVSSWLICTNISQWLSEQDSSFSKDIKSGKIYPFSDPHNCESSCAERGPNCLACSNTSYFLCDQSSKCIHPSLVCDGHPQCLDQSDEDQCQNNSKSNLVLDVSSALFLVFFIGFTIY